MTIDITTYKPVDKSDTCKRCGSKTVTWWRDSEGKPHLGEIFVLGEEEVFCETDHHLRYCPNPIVTWKKTETEFNPLSRAFQRQLELNQAADDFFEDTKPTIEHDGHPYCCESCGAGIIDGLDGLHYDFSDDTIGKPHTCPAQFVSHVANARAKGTNIARKVKFADISEHMRVAHDSMKMRHTWLVERGQKTNEDTTAAQLAAEYLMLRKRLYTEIPS